MDEGRVLGIRFDFVAQGGDEPVNAAVAGKTVVAPDGVEDLVAGEGFACFFQEQLQQFEFFGGEFDIPAVLGEAAGGDIEGEISELVGGGLVLLGAAQESGGIWC